MQDVATCTDGLAAGASGKVSAFSVETVAAWGADQLTGYVTSMIISYAFSYVDNLIFGAPTDPLSAIENTLAQISTQLGDIITNQTAILNNLSAIKGELAKIDQDAILNALASPLAKIQTHVGIVKGYASSTSSIASATLLTEANNILDPNAGVLYALTQMHDIIMGTSGGTSLMAALLQCNQNPTGSNIQGLKQNFFSNQNCFVNAQTLFHYYDMIQTQGVQLVIQAYNYQQNQSIADSTTTLALNPQSQTFYNSWLIGGSGPSAGTAPYIQQQRDAYRNTYQQYYQNFQVYMGPLPDDMVVCLIPDVSNQIAPIFYNVDSGLLVLGLVSFALRNWSAADSNVLAAQTCITDPTGWTLPPVFQAMGRFPSQAELTTIVKQAQGSSYQGMYYQYLQDQGFTDDSVNYNAQSYLTDSNVTVWTNGNASVQYIFQVSQDDPPGRGQFTDAQNFPPYDINNKVQPPTSKFMRTFGRGPQPGFTPWQQSDSLAGSEELAFFPPIPSPYYWGQIQGDFPIVLLLNSNLNLTYCTSMAYNLTQNSSAWGFSMNQVFGGLIVVGQPNPGQLFGGSNGTVFILMDGILRGFPNLNTCNHFFENMGELCTFQSDSPPLPTGLASPTGLMAMNIMDGAQLISDLQGNYYVTDQMPWDTSTIVYRHIINLAQLNQFGFSVTPTKQSVPTSQIGVPLAIFTNDNIQAAQTLAGYQAVQAHLINNQPMNPYFNNLLANYPNPQTTDYSTILTQQIAAAQAVVNALPNS